MDRPLPPARTEEVALAYRHLTERGETTVTEVEARHRRERQRLEHRQAAEWFAAQLLVVATEANG